jgi:predicted dehydrogenase
MSMSTAVRVKVGVIGVGYLGEHHARLYASMPHVELVGVYDLNGSRAAEIASKYGTRPFDDWTVLADGVQALSVAVPTVFHHQVAGALLARGKDVLVEKPMTPTLKEADDLIQEAERQGRILQVGHSERFNGGVEAVAALADHPRFIEIHRLGRFSERGTDVDVVLDLMIHDIDIVLSLARSPVREIRAIGVSVLTPRLDIANTRMEFENGCVANITASRVSMDRLRKIRIFQRDAYITLDYDKQQLGVFRKRGDRIDLEEIPIEKKEPLRAELEDFVRAVATRGRPRVSGYEGREAIRVALAVQEAAVRAAQDDPSL